MPTKKQTIQEMENLLLTLQEWAFDEEYKDEESQAPLVDLMRITSALLWICKSENVKVKSVHGFY